MRHVIPFALLTATLLAGCQWRPTVVAQAPPPAPATTPAFKPTLVTARGTNTTADGLWRIGVSVAGDSLELSHHQTLKGESWSDSVWITDSRHEWQVRPGWFVYIENASRVWAYDGDRDLNLLAVTTNSGSWYGPRQFPDHVPADVLSRLTEPARRAVEPNE